jgi:hypothetical protein
MKLLHIYIVDLIVLFACALRSDLKGSSDGEKHITSKRSIQKRNQTANFSQHKKDQALWIYMANVSLCVGSFSFSLFLAIFAQRDTNQILMLSPQEATAAAESSIKLLYLNMR